MLLALKYLAAKGYPFAAIPCVFTADKLQYTIIF
jgi:hypothetical protein